MCSAQRIGLQRTAEIVDSAHKYAFHSKSPGLDAVSIQLAAGMPAHGHGGAALPQLLQVHDADLLCRAEAELDTSEVMHSRLPSAPLEVGVAPHWLAVDGLQPTTAENAQPKHVKPCIQGSAPERPKGRGSCDTKAFVPGPTNGAGPGQLGEAASGLMAGLPLRHSMPDELQLYYDMVRRTVQSKGRMVSSAPLARQAVAASLATDPGLQPVLPYLVPLLADEVAANLGDVEHLRLVLSAMQGLLSNPHLELVPYIHHLLPAIVTCLVARNMGSNGDDWHIRDQAAALLGHIAFWSKQRQDELAEGLARVQKALAASLFDVAPQTQYGALVGLTAFGVPVLLHTVVPNLKRYAQLIQVKDSGSTTLASLQVRAALLSAVGQCMSWNGGALAVVVKRLMSDAGFGAVALAVSAAPAIHL